MPNEKLIAYLNKRENELATQLESYYAAVAEQKIAEENYKAACKKVDDFGEVSTLVDEREYVKELIDEFTPAEPLTVEPAELVESVDNSETETNTPAFLNDVAGIE